MITYEELTSEQRHLYLQALVAVARADGAIDEAETAFLADIAVGCGVDEATLAGLLKGEAIDPSQFPPLRGEVGALILRDAAAMAVINNDFTEGEEALIKAMGSALGFAADEVEEFLNWGFMGMQWQKMAVRLIEQYA
ncbi:MAG: hypothetical protein HC924_12125 [Synechococcaceae cyanobacterium SM2_3_2]|nr:hypothetical protein [Synechococcaceae cyanobacterium SM2_3_2]